MGLILGTVLGAGIFRTPALVASNSGGEGAFLLAWGLGGMLSLVGALCYAQLATTYPDAGGDYHFLRRAFGDRGAAAALKPNAWVSIGTDGVVSIVSPSSEMGQGVMTSMPALVAEEMDADWRKVRVVQAPSDAKSFGNPLFGGAMTTGASRTTQGYYRVLRLAGVQTRKVILANVAAQWKVPVGELSTEPGRVVHGKSGRKIGYGDVAKFAKVPNPLPEATPAEFKPLDQCRLIGRNVPRVDVPSKTNGTAKYGIEGAMQAGRAVGRRPPASGSVRPGVPRRSG